MAGNFNNVSMGDGVLSVNGVDVGYLYGNVKYSFSYEIEKFKTGIPRKLRGQQAKEVTATITAPLAELSVENASMALGGLAITTNSGATVTVTSQAKTFAAGYLGHGWESVTLDAGDLKTGADKPVVKNSGETVTYTENTDYVVDYTLGIIVRNPGGAITAGQAVKVTYKYDPAVSKQVNLGATFALAQVPVDFVHTRPNTGKDVSVKMWLASVNGKLDMNYDRDNWIVNEVTIEAIADDTGHPANPLGYIQFES